MTAPSSASDPAAELDALAALFRLGTTAVLTGAGISTDSGLPDYRGEGSPPRKPMNIEQFAQDAQYRRRFWAGARVGQTRMSVVEPNEGHRVLARLESAGYVDGVITQNVDGLHSRAGSHTVVELHGHGATIRCMSCGSEWPRSEVLTWFDQANPGFAERNADVRIAPDGDADVRELDSVTVPDCPVCGGMLRPAVVYFGETVPPPVFHAAADLVNAADAFVVVGSSLAVNTGIRLVIRAERRGIPIAAINRGPTELDARPSLSLRIEGGTSETLTALAEELGV